MIGFAAGVLKKGGHRVLRTIDAKSVSQGNPY